MHLRNSRFLFVLIAFLFIHLASGAQGTLPPKQGTDAGAVTPSSVAPQQQGQQAPSAPPAQGQTTPQNGTQTPPSSPAAAPDQSQQPPTPAVPPATQNQTAPSEPQSGPPPTNDSGVFVFKKEVEEVVLHATVVDEKMRLITTLDRGAFNVFENDQPQPITSFRHEDVPVAMGIVIDNSGSMREKRDKVNKAALNLVRASNPQDQVFVVNFNDEYFLDQDFTGDIKKLQQALEKVEARGGTALYDAMVASADYMKKNAKLQKKVLFVVTDGEDNASTDTLEQAIRQLQQENGPTVYAIGLLGEERARRARRALETMAERTGGIAFLPKTLDEVDDISRTVAHDIRNQYTIGYKPKTPKSVGGYRTIRVDARAKGYKKLTVRTRTGYYPGQEHSPGGAP
jgi:Ca-activated chloride channel family protein